MADARLRFFVLAGAQTFAALVCTLTSLAYANALPKFLPAPSGGLLWPAPIVWLCAWLFVRIAWIWLAGCASHDDGDLKSNFIRFAAFQAVFMIAALGSVFATLAVFVGAAIFVLVCAGGLVIVSIFRSFTECSWLSDLSHRANATNGAWIRAFAVTNALAASFAWLTLIPPLNGQVWFPALLAFALASGAVASVLLAQTPPPIKVSSPQLPN